MLLPPIVSPASVASRLRAKGILPENTDSKRAALVCRNLPRPFDESAKVIEVGGFHFVVSGSRILRLQDTEWQAKPMLRLQL